MTGGSTSGGTDQRAWYGELDHASPVQTPPTCSSAVRIEPSSHPIERREERQTGGATAIGVSVPHEFDSASREWQFAPKVSSVWKCVKLARSLWSGLEVPRVLLWHACLCDDDPSARSALPAEKHAGSLAHFRETYGSRRK